MECRVSPRGGLSYWCEVKLHHDGRDEMVWQGTPESCAAVASFLDQNPRLMQKAWDEQGMGRPPETAEVLEARQCYLATARSLLSDEWDPTGVEREKLLELATYIVQAEG